MKNSIIKDYKNYGLFQSYWVVNEKYAYFVVLSKYGATLIKKHPVQTWLKDTNRL